VSDKPAILVVDDDRLIRVSMVKQLTAAGFTAATAESGIEALSAMATGEWGVVLSDLRMPGMDGLTFLEEVKQRFPDVAVIMMTAYGTVESAVKALKLGAYDYLTKPFHFEEVLIRLDRIATQQACQAEVLKLRELISESAESMGLFGASLSIQRIRDQITAYAGSSVPLLVTGETGTGKEVVARAVHEQGRGKDKPFIAVGCGTIPREIAESELFGHEKGSFSGAMGKHKGAFERADGGTMLLDDIDDLPLDLQVKLLRIIQEGTFNRVGGETEFAVDVRVIATTKVDLEEEAEQGRFRPDLFYRLRGLEIHLPPLRERGDDVFLLAAHFLQVIAAKDGSKTKHLDPSAAPLLKHFPWRGNVRELMRAMESAVILSRSDEIRAEDLPAFLRSTPGVHRPFSLNIDNMEKVSLPELLSEFEAQLLDWALARAGGKQTAASELLGIPRTTFQSKLHERDRRIASTPNGPGGGSIGRD